MFLVIIKSLTSTIHLIDALEREAVKWIPSGGIKDESVYSTYQFGLTYSNDWVQQVRCSREHDFMLGCTEVDRQVSGEPLHDYVVGPIHAEVCHIDSPKRPVA